MAAAASSHKGLIKVPVGGLKGPAGVNKKVPATMKPPGITTQASHVFFAQKAAVRVAIPIQKPEGRPEQAAPPPQAAEKIVIDLC